MRKAGSSRRKRKAVVSSEDEDDKPLFPAKLVPQATAVSPEAPPKFSVSPEDVLDIGEGNPQKGHDELDKFIIDTRRRYVKHLAKLPGPVRD